MSEIAAISAIALAAIGIGATTLGLALACSCWDRRRAIKHYHRQRKN